MLKGKILISIMVLVISTFTKLSYGFEVNVHREITKSASTNTNSLLDGKIKDAGFLNGIKEMFNGKDAIELFQDGSQKEDEPLWEGRYLKHFYNPLDGSGLGIFNSSYVWANDYYANEWSWRSARSNYYTGLTATTDSERRAALADSFRSIGQVMHLVQDLASPAHVRNDPHPVFDGYEAHTKNNIDSLNYSLAPISIPTTSVSFYAPRQFWDSDTYDGTNPSGSSAIGLAEYTNANFFSGDTVANGSFPYPKIYSDTTIDFRSITNPNTGNTYPRMYYSKKYDGETNNGQGYLLCTVAFLDDWRARVIPIATPDQPFHPVLDDNVYKDYANLLIPRAVGYSAGLLNYFFRGKVNMGKDPQNAGKYIIKNESGEKMEGTFALYYDDASGDRNAVSGASWTITINPNSASSPVTFTEPTSPAPKEKGKYILVFQGKLGMEEGAVVGREVKLGDEIWEPWDEGNYTQTRHLTSYWKNGTFKIDNEWFNFKTGKRIWKGGWSTRESQEPSIKVEDGKLKIDAYNGSYLDSSAGYYKSDASGSIWTDDFSQAIPLSGCKLKISMPYATMSYMPNTGDNYFTISISMSNGTRSWSQLYRLKEATVPTSAFAWDTLSIWVNAGDIERDLEADLRRGVAEQSTWPWWRYGPDDDYIGNINDWYVTSVWLSYNLRLLNTQLSLAIDYIDFECSE